MEHVVNLVKATRCQNFTQDKNTFPGELIRKEESRDLSPSRLMEQTSKQIFIFSKSQKFFFFILAVKDSSWPCELHSQTYRFKK